MSKDTKFRMVSPRGIANWPKLNEPDTKWDPEGKYTCKLILDANDADVQAFVAQLERIRDDFFNAKVEELKAEKKMALARELGKADVIKVDYDQETGDETGKLIFGASMKAKGVRKDGTPWSQKPTIFNAKGVELKSPPMISGGSTLKLSVEVSPFVNATTKAVTLSVRLKAAQLIKLNSGGARSFSDHGFGTEEDGDDVGDYEGGSGFGDESADSDVDASAPEHDDL